MNEKKELESKKKKLEQQLKYLQEKTRIINHLINGTATKLIHVNKELQKLIEEEKQGFTL